MTDKGLRYNSDKLPVHLVPPEATEAMARGLAYGAKKYAARNWEKGMDWYKDVVGSLRRHILEWEKGNDIDDESGLLHTDHIATNAAFLSTFVARKVGRDDRPRVVTREKLVSGVTAETLPDSAPEPSASVTSSIVALWEEGFPAREIVEMLKVSLDTVSHTLRLHGLKTHRGGSTNENLPDSAPESTVSAVEIVDGYVSTDPDRVSGLLNMYRRMLGNEDLFCGFVRQAFGRILGAMPWYNRNAIYVGILDDKAGVDDFVRAAHHEYEADRFAEAQLLLYMAMNRWGEVCFHVYKVLDDDEERGFFYSAEGTWRRKHK